MYVSLSKRFIRVKRHELKYYGSSLTPKWLSGTLVDPFRPRGFQVSRSIGATPDVVKSWFLECAEDIVEEQRRGVMLDAILEDVKKERLHQEVLKKQGKFAHTCADLRMTHHERLTVLTEEVGEVARAALVESGLAKESKPQDLEKELIQVAAVAVAWIEALRSPR